MPARCSRSSMPWPFFCQLLLNCRITSSLGPSRRDVNLFGGQDNLAFENLSC
jgi:hypothetical protein